MRHLKRRNLRRLENSDRQRLIQARIVHPHDDDLEARKRLEKMWEESVDFFENYKTTSSPQE